MICAVNSPEREAAFLSALRGQDLPAVQIGAHWSAFGALPGSGWQFYTGTDEDTPFALAVKGTSAQCCGPCDLEELGVFLRFLGVRQLAWRGPAPAGYQAEEPVCQFLMRRENALRIPEEPFPAGLALQKEPSLLAVTGLVMEAPDLAAAGQDFFDEFYSRGCALRNRGLAQVWTLEAPGCPPASTAGIYGIWEHTAYLAAVHTRAALRRNGLAGRLVRALAAEQARQGNDTALWCRPAQADFYTALGFEACGTVPQYLARQA